jgi:nitroimidazol reductase NimA-like FMN-containing flavoprotein (pyridoxamine 5'-phosphate oxidase superfamily)
MPRAPEFFIMSRQDCADMLGRNHVGRLAYRDASRLNIQPIGYVARDNVLFLRSAPGAKMDALARDPYVAFEVDEIEGPFDWRSVVVQGTIYTVERDGSAAEQRAVDAIRSVMRGAFTDRDPAPDRKIIYGLYVHEVAGRMAQSHALPSGRVRVTPRAQGVVRRLSDRS